MAAFEWGSAIKITFDRKIISDMPAASGSEDYAIPFAAGGQLSSGDMSGYPKNNAFDGSTTTYWRSSSTVAGQYIGTDFGAAAQLTKVIARFDYASGRPNAYQLQGCDDGSSWVDVATGNFANASGDQTITFTATTYRYWRLYFTSKYSIYYTCSELKFYGTRDAYTITGWLVQGYEPAMAPGGDLVLATYTVRKITKVDDDYALILWLGLASRMKHPQGQVTITFTGALLSEGNAVVEPFSVSFTPSNIAPIFNPAAPEYLELADITITAATLSLITYYSYQSGYEYLELSDINITQATLTHIDDLPE